MRGHPLIEVENLISLGAAGRSVARQILKAAPFAAVRCNESVQIHAHTVFAPGPCRDGRIRCTCHEGQHHMSSSTVGVGVDDLVTGEAVALELPAAGIAMHALSGILDVSIAVLALVIGLIVVPIVTEGADAAIA